MPHKEFKILKIANCQECPYYIFDDSLFQNRWGKHWCRHKDGNFKVKKEGIGIPKKCPLNDKVNLASLEDIENVDTSYFGGSSKKLGDWVENKKELGYIDEDIDRYNKSGILKKRGKA